MILVTGATGTVGRAVIDQLLDADVPVRAVSRRPADAGLPADVPVLGADLDDPDTLVPALEGVDSVFLLSTGPGLPRHDANVAKAAATAGAGRIVKLSSGRVGDPAATDPIPSWHRLGEQAVRDCGLPWTMVRPMGFMANALHWAPTVRTQDTVYAPFGHGRIAAVDPVDIAAVAVRALAEPGHAGRSYLLSGPQALSPGEQTEILAEVLDRPLRYVETTPDQARDALLRLGIDAETADAIMALRATALESFTSVVHPTVPQVTGRPARTFTEWASDHRAAFA